jgi:hypothetical protein
MSKKLTEVIIPEFESEKIYISDLTEEDSIVAYDGDKFLGIILYDQDGDWYLQNSSYCECTLAELVRDLKRNYKNFNLIVLNK